MRNVIIGFVLGCLSTFGITYFNKSPDPERPPIQIDRVVHDSILVEIHVTDTLIKHIRDNGKKDSIVIANQSVEDDLVFFSTYIDLFSE